jgi:hypothetical protein
MAVTPQPPLTSLDVRSLTEIEQNLPSTFPRSERLLHFP